MAELTSHHCSSHPRAPQAGECFALRRCTPQCAPTSHGVSRETHSKAGRESNQMQKPLRSQKYPKSNPVPWKNQVLKSAFLGQNVLPAITPGKERRERSTASTTTTLFPLPPVLVPSSQDSLVTDSGGPDLTWMKLKMLQALFTQNPCHTWHVLKDTGTAHPQNHVKALPCCVHEVFYMCIQSHTVCKVVLTSM